MQKLTRFAPWLVAAGVAWSLGFLYNTYYGGLISWLGRMYEHKRVLAAEIQGPRRLIIAGGSGVHYTLNAKLMEEKLGFPVFNFGLDGNLGLNVILPLILKEIRPGDVVLLAPEYLLLLDEDGIGERSVPFSVTIRQPGLTHIPPKLFAEDAFKLGVPTLRTLVKSGRDLVEKGKIDDYYTDPITERGDPTKTWQRKSKWWQMGVEHPVTPHSLQVIAQFKEELKAKGATLVLSLPWVYARTDEPTRSNVQKTADELSKIAPLLYDKASLNLKTDSSWFADTHYHLQPEARIMRSKELVQELQPILKKIDSQGKGS